jgi:2-keto-4-pentenoate hydratase/2-oxohepta-3-ene-1,7-dioic acid hydratase in catechol pathway
MPEASVIREDIKRLKEEFFQYKLSDYIDIYKDNYAMTKFIYHFEKYLEPGLKRRCKKWCDDFNYANHALEEVTKKKEKFIPVKDEDMIQL